MAIIPSNGDGRGTFGSARLLVVEDYEPFRRFVWSMLEKRTELQVIGEALDGLEAVRKAEELQPDLILLDVGLPTLNGIEAARRIRKLSSESKILFVSQESSADVVQEALRAGARGYVVKTDAGSELLEAVNTVLRGDLFVGKRFFGHDFVGASDAIASEEFRTKSALPLQRNIEITHRHDVGFYSDDAGLLDDLTRFIGAALKAGNVAIVVATESHRASLLQRLQAGSVDVAAAIERKRYIPLDVPNTFSPVQFAKFMGDLIVEAVKATGGEHLRVAAG